MDTHGSADSTAQAELVPGLRALDMELQLPLFKCRANDLRPPALGGAAATNEYREWVLDWPLYVPTPPERDGSATAEVEGGVEGDLEGGGLDVNAWLSTLPRAADWDEAEKVVEAHGAWQEGLAEPSKNIALTASFSSAGSSTNSTPSAMPLCTHMGEAHALAALMQVLAGWERGGSRSMRTARRAGRCPTHTHTRTHTHTHTHTHTQART